MKVGLKLRRGGAKTPCTWGSLCDLCRLCNKDIPIIACVVSNVNRGTWEWDKKSMRLDYILAFHSKPLENRLDIREGISADLRKTFLARMNE